MSRPPPVWTATLTVRPPRPEMAGWLERALRPEAEREVPRARAAVRRSPEGAVEVAIEAQDAGAMRAALNTYLGWVQLAWTTARTAGRVVGSEEGPD